MRSRWFLIDTRFLSISFTLDNTDFDLEEHNPLTALIFDISLRPIATVHISSVWTTYNRCVNFAILFTSFQSFSYQSDIFETDEMFHYPTPGQATFIAFLGHCWGVFALMLMRRWFRFYDQCEDLYSSINRSLQSPTG